MTVTSCTNRVLVKFNTKLLPVIDKNTQPEQLKCGQFEIGFANFYIADSSGQTILHKAARSGNVKLIYYCIKTIGPDLLSLGDGKQRIALYSAVENNQLQSAQALLKLGSPVNITRAKCNLPISTSLWYAAQITHNVALCELLLRYDGIAFPELRESGRNTIQQAKNNIQRRMILHMILLDNFTPFPKVISEIVTDFLR